MLKTKIKDLTTKASFTTYIPTLPTEGTDVVFYHKGKKVRCQIDSIDMKFTKKNKFKYFVICVFPFE